MCHSLCLGAGQQHRVPSAGAELGPQELNLLHDSLGVKSLKYSPESMEPRFSRPHSCTGSLWSFSQVPGDLKTYEDKLGFNLFLILHYYDTLLSRYPEYLLSQLLPAVQWQLFYFGSISTALAHLKAPVYDCPSIQVPPIYSSLSSDFRLLLTLFLSLDFSLCL